jgi:O-antigen/teichoic acid export membrane protein
VQHGAKVNYYGISRIRSSLIHFVLGKTASGVASLLVVVLTIRELPVPEYAVLVTLQALVMMIRTLTSFGTNAVLLRYLPDLRVVGNNRATYAMLFGGIGLRSLLYVLPIAAVVYFAGDLLARLLNLGEWGWLLGWYLLLVGCLRVTATFTGWALESLLWQKQAQYSIAVSTLVKLGGVLILLSTGSFDLPNLVWLELGTEALAVLLLFCSMFVSWRADPHRHDGDLRTLYENRGRYLRFSFWAYLFNLTTVLNGSAPNRLIVSHYLGTASTALFGAVDRLIQMIKQYEPVKLLIGLVRPVFNAQYRASGEDFDSVAEMADGIFRLNLIVLAIPLLPFTVAGEYLFDIITNGKYTDASGIFLGFYMVLVLGSFMLILELLVKAVELNSVFTISNLCMSGSVLAAIPFLPTVGLWALVWANLLGYLGAIVVVCVYLAYKKYRLGIRWRLVGLTVLAVIVSIAIGNVAMALGMHPLVAIVVSYIAFGAALWLLDPFTPKEMEVGKALLFKRLHAEGAE